MTYIVMEIQTGTDGTVGNLIYSYTNRSQAEQQYHLILSAAAVSILPAHAAVLMTNEGQVVDRKCYHHEQPTPEPEPEPSEGE